MAGSTKDWNHQKSMHLKISTNAEWVAYHHRVCCRHVKKNTGAQDHLTFIPLAKLLKWTLVSPKCLIKNSVINPKKSMYKDSNSTYYCVNAWNSLLLHLPITDLFSSYTEYARGWNRFPLLVHESDVPILKKIQWLLRNENLSFEFNSAFIVEKIHLSHSEFKDDYCDGRAFQSHPLYSVHPCPPLLFFLI